MKFDIFLSICQTDVDGYLPSERVMFQNFFEQLKCADELGFETAWVAETHLSCQVQKENPGAVIPFFKGEIGLNTDILQLAHLAFKHTERIHIGSAIRNIVCNGGPVAHAEAVKTFLTLHELMGPKERNLQLGFAAGRFPFTNSAYGFNAKTELEKSSWEIIKNKYFQQATEIFLRLLKNESLASRNIETRYLSAKDYRDPKQWDQVRQNFSSFLDSSERIPLPQHWDFEKVGVIPFEAKLDRLKLTIGTHDPETQIIANQFLPVGVFNLSIVPEKVIAETHERMKANYHKAGGPWRRELMPRTVMIFLEDQPGKSDSENSQQAKAMAERAWRNYWSALEGTIDTEKVQQAVSNTIAGNWKEVLQQMKAKYHPEDRIMAWFDFNNHDNENVKTAMKTFIEKVARELQ